MKTLLFLLGICMISIQSLYAQTSHFEPINLNSNAESMDLHFHPNPVEDVLNLKNAVGIDYIRLYDKHGELVDQFIPVDDTVNLNKLNSGLYMVCAYREGLPIKKRILKKL